MRIAKLAAVLAVAYLSSLTVFAQDTVVKITSIKTTTLNAGQSYPITVNLTAGGTSTSFIRTVVYYQSKDQLSQRIFDCSMYLDNSASGDYTCGSWTVPRVLEVRTYRIEAEAWNQVVTTPKTGKPSTSWMFVAAATPILVNSTAK